MTKVLSWQRVSTGYEYIQEMLAAYLALYCVVT